MSHAPYDATEASAGMNEGPMTNPPTPERDRGDEINTFLTQIDHEGSANTYKASWYRALGRSIRDLLAQLDAAESELHRRDTFESCDGCSTGDCPHQSDAECIQAQAEIVKEQEARIVKLEAQLDEQRDVIEKLPKTKDGVPVAESSGVCFWDDELGIVCITGVCIDSSGWNTRANRPVYACYSTAEAAVAAALAASGGSDE